MKPLRTLRSAALVLEADDVDTDQIIPARFLTTTVKHGLGRHLFHDWRYDADGSPRPAFVLNRPEAAGREVLVAGRNFGCGSSREHAPWALADWGVRVVVALSFADIFRSNALKNGLLPVALEPAVHQALRALLARSPHLEVEVDVAEQRLTVPGGPSARFDLDAFARRCLLEGLDPLGYLLRFEDAITDHEQRLPAAASDRTLPSPARPSYP